MESTTTLRLLPLREPDLDRLRQPPANTEAEQALLGAMLINNAAYHRVAEFLYRNILATRCMVVSMPRSPS